MRGLLTCFLSASVFLVSFGQDTHVISLYDGVVPNSKLAPDDYAEKNSNGWVTMVTKPELAAFLPPGGKSTGAAVIVIPGGAYAGLAINHEGIDVAKRFASLGITAFVLKYRLPDDRIMPERSIGPLQDAERAIQLVRQRAAEWHIDPHRVGIIGFSAGGHLASSLGTHYNEVVIKDMPGISLRPDFMMLIYPVISMGQYTHQGSKQNLIGTNATTDQIIHFSNEKQVNAQTPVAFIVHAEDDTAVPVENSLNFYKALKDNGVKAEMHLYPQGGHGFGMYNSTTSDSWFDRCINWLQANKLLTQ
ncbi:1,4-beta-xylanase [Mucilaginibacter sp. PPCGB 2223]|nr:1,4-beta-xylanase [Mucilaginibacter sp. PPCGB 2223]